MDITPKMYNNQKQQIDNINFDEHGHQTWKKKRFERCKK